MENLPISVSIIFALTTFLTVAIFLKASNFSRVALFTILGWLILQSAISLTGFYTITNTIPPRFFLLVAPPVLFIILLFLTQKGKNFIHRLDLKYMTILHIVRIPVEIVLFLLFINNTIPGLMTFEGRNFDILSGITAPFIYYFGFILNRLNRKVILAWNFICLALLINIVTIAILSAPFPFQKLAFDQPNIAVMYFPFIWLPSCIVPLVLFSHLVAIRKLLRKK